MRLVQSENSIHTQTRILLILGIVVSLFCLPACMSLDESSSSDDHSDSDELNDNALDDDELVVNDYIDDDFDDDATPEPGLYEFAPQPSDEIGVFVSTLGNDLNPGTLSQPVKRIQRGIELATEVGKSVFVATGTYEGSVVTTVSLYGGYSHDFMQRDIELWRTEIVANGDTGVEISNEETRNSVVMEGFLVHNATETDGVRISNDTDLIVTTVLSQNIIWGGKGESSVGVRIRNGATLIVNNIITGGAYNSPDVLNRGVSGIRVSGENEHIYSYVYLAGNTIRAGVTEGGSAVGIGITLCHAYLYGNLIDGGVATGTNSQSTAIASDLYYYSPSLIDLFSNIILIGTSEKPAIGLESLAGWAFLYNNDIWGPGSPCLFSQYDFSEEFNLCLKSFFMMYLFMEEFQYSANISQDPMLLYDSETSRISADSPCIDAGINPNELEDDFGFILDDLGLELIDLVSIDADGDPRPYGAGWDIGPDEWRP